MGFFLKETLKTMCGSNQWSYAVFWSIGCQNPKLLIWEDCHYEPSPCSVSSAFGSAKMPFREWECGWNSSENGSIPLGIQAEERVRSLIDKMMLNNQINVVGEGIVGRAAFSGKHQWILTNNYSNDAHPPEVLNEMHQQFSAGMQTVAVIPVLPLGVVQLGSSFTIMENIGFVNDVKSLILHLGGIPDALLSGNYTAKDPAEEIRVPVTLGMPKSVDLSGNSEVIKPSLTVEKGNQHHNSSQASRLVGQLSQSLTKEIENNHHGATSSFQSPDQMQKLPNSQKGFCKSKVTTITNPNFTFEALQHYGDISAEVNLPKSEAWLNQLASSSSGFDFQPGFDQSDSAWLNQRDSSSSGFNFQPGFGQSGSVHDLKLRDHQILSGAGIQCGSQKGLVRPPSFEGSLSHGEMKSYLKPISSPHSLPNTQKEAVNNQSGLTNFGGTEFQNIGIDGVSFPGLVDRLTNGPISGGSYKKHSSAGVKHSHNELASTEPSIDGGLFQALIRDNQNLETATQSPRLPNFNEETWRLPQSGDNLFDILGEEYRNKLIICNWNSLLDKGPSHNRQNLGAVSPVFANMHDAGLNSDIYSMSEEMSDNDMFTRPVSDHLLDAVVSSSKADAMQTSDTNVSCEVTSEKFSSSSLTSSFLSYGRPSTSDPLQNNFFGLPQLLGIAGTLETSCFTPDCRKDDVGSYSQTTSVHGSQISSLVEQGNSLKPDNSVSTALSRKPDEVSKSTRKRLKHGENPRPRPKDRQMIQDRVKELREIVPNGAKCSIDALLERTVKHMLFLQSVTAHAEKLKQTGESKIMSKEGGRFLKDKFEAGATWAFDVGSQSMACPIIVEDLCPPRQMLVEMLCEERGFFLEIADLIRGLGLTIMKGEMEARNDKIWARFAVEANRDVTRMEIFMAVVPLLEQTMRGTGSAAKTIDNMIIHNSFPKTSPIPATGMSSSLQ